MVAVIGPFLFQRESQLNLVRGCNQEVREHAFEPALFVLVMQHHDGNDTYGAAASMACGHFPLQVL